jgi:histidinol-phosphate aminotransferase
MVNRRQLMKGGVMTAFALSLEKTLLSANPGNGAHVSTTGAPLPVRLWGNENPHGPSQSARRAMMEAIAAGNRYSMPADYAELERLIARREGLTPEHVLLASGSGEILAMAGVAYGLDRGEILSADPTFAGLMRYAEKVGASVTRVPLNERFEHDLEGMHRRLNKNVRLVYVCNPNNPTGTIVAGARLRDFCEAGSRTCAVMVDEAYRDYADAPEFGTMVDLVRKGLNVLVVRTFSKIHALAGMRVGYALARPETVARLREFRMGIINQVGLKGAIASYQDEAFLRFSRAKNLEARAIFYRAMDAMGRRYVPTQGNFVWLRAGADNRDLPLRLAERGVFITGNQAPLNGDWARVTLGTPEEMRLFAEAYKGAMKL